MFSGKISKIIFIVISLSILILSLLPYVPSKIGNFSDKATHIIAYGVLACSFILAFTSKRINFVLLCIISVFVCTLYGGLIEVLQNFTYRSPELLDVIADFAGSVTGTFITAGFVILMKKRQS